METPEINIGDEFFGNFTIPNDESFKHTGELIIEPTGDIKLILLDDFISSENLQWLSKDEIDNIIGHVINKKTNKEYILILYSASLIRLKIGTLKIKTYFINQLLISNINYYENKLKYDTLYVSSNLFSDNTKHIDLNKSEIESGTIKVLGNTENHILKNSEIELSIIHNNIQKLENHKGFTILFENNLRIIFNNAACDIIFINEYVKKLERLFTLYFECPILFDNINIKSVDGNKYKLFKQPIKNNLNKITKSDIYNFWPTFENQLFNLNRVYADDKRLRLLNTFFFAYLNNKIDIINRFLNLAFVLEFFYDITMEVQPVVKPKKTTFKYKITELNNYYIKSILINFEELLFNEAELEKIKDTRNFHVHMEPDKPKDENNYLKTGELVEINKKIIMLISKLINHLWIERNPTSK